ncbi:MAG: hypothetical protein N4A65_16265 [Cohaesibacter sp.]|jgi:hypothetical protein|nr:hypothetical protein [Cohaesibacter sp.]
MDLRKALSSLGLLIMGYWFMFWTLNGLDKYLNRTDLGLFSWYGNDRDEKFAMYFDRLGLGEGAVNPVLMFAGVWELVAAALCVVAMIAIAKNAPIAEKMEKSQQAIVFTFITFIGFCIFDVVVGDRAELLEHSTYIGVAIVSYILLALEPVFEELNKAQPTADHTDGYSPYGQDHSPRDPAAIAAE